MTYKLSYRASDSGVRGAEGLLSIIFTFSCLATSFADEPETSIHVFEKRAQADSIKTT
jgi:hypothetical protein